jgi:hypothetical protein
MVVTLQRVGGSFGVEGEERKGFGVHFLLGMLWRGSGFRFTRRVNGSACSGRQTITTTTTTTTTIVIIIATGTLITS